MGTSSSSRAGRATRWQLSGDETQAYSQARYQACPAWKLPLLGDLPPLGGPVGIGDLPALNLMTGSRGPAAPLSGQSHGARPLAPVRACTSPEMRNGKEATLHQVGRETAGERNKFPSLPPVMALFPAP